jgi:hypothetical protein
LSLVDTLKRARGFVAAGWAEPFCRDSHGRMCTPTAEDVEKYSVLDSLNHCASSPEDVWRAWEALESVITPRRVAFFSFLRVASWEDSKRLAELARASLEETELQLWLEAKGRHIAPVLHAFDVAILRAAAIERATLGAT